jgi:aminoglycoside phosphotransferase (APT) family kinase protein
VGEDGTTSGDAVPGIDVDAVTAWLAERAEVAPPLTFVVIEGGRSNLTYRVVDAADRTLILRRPPLHGVLESAHDMGREHRIITALDGSSVPVPSCVGYEADPDVTGAPFYVMEHVDGVVVRGADDAERHLDVGTRAAATDDLVDVLVRLHDVDVDAVGLGELARREGYLERQLRRWQGQLEKGRTRELPLLDEVHSRLAGDVPDQGPATIVHGDYRLDNLILDPDTGRVRAVLDWELTTLGDPLADLGLLLVYWSEPGDRTIPLLEAPTLVEGFPSRAHVADRYAERSGRRVDEIGYYVAFGYWKLACILEGVYTRYRSGAYGDTGEGDSFGRIVLELGERASEAAAEVGR